MGRPNPSRRSAVRRRAGSEPSQCDVIRQARNPARRVQVAPLDQRAPVRRLANIVTLRPGELPAISRNWIDFRHL